MTIQQYDRRIFLKLTGYSLTAGLLASCSTKKALATSIPPAYFPETIFKEPATNGKILVTYASCTGFTGGVAEEIYKTLTNNGLQAELCLMKNVSDLSPYKAIIAGSAIQDKQWLPEAMEFINAHQEILSKKPLAIFMVCMTLAMPNGEKYRQGLKEWLNPVRKLVKPVSEGYFAGGLEIERIPRLKDRIMFRLSVAAGVWKEGDHRNWEAIRTWAQELTPSLKS